MVHNLYVSFVPTREEKGGVKKKQSASSVLVAIQVLVYFLSFLLLFTTQLNF